MTQGIQPNRPTTLIAFGGNILGTRLVELLSTQRSNIILVDEFNRQSRSQIRKIKKQNKIKTYDLSGLESLSSEIKRIDYIFILLNQFTELHEGMSSKQFLSLTNTVDTLLKLGHKHNSKVLLTTTISLHRKLANIETLKIERLSDTTISRAYTLVEIQRYCETLAAEYHDQASLDIRIARVGEIIGKGISLEKNTVFTNLIKEAVTKPRITIKGEGLDSTYYIHILDVVYGLIKTIFSSKTNGEVFSLSYPEELSTLSLAYKILELNPKAQEIAFAESEDITPQQIYVPAKNLSKIGWKPKIRFDKALLETLEYVHEQYKIAWKNRPEQEFFSEKIVPKKRKLLLPKAHISEQVTPIGRFFQYLSLPFQFLLNIAETGTTKIKKIKITPASITKFLVKLAAFLILYVFLMAPVLQIISGGIFTYVYAKTGYRQMYNLNTQSAQKSLQKADFFSSVLRQGWQGLRWVSYIPGTEEFYDNTAKILSGVNHICEGAYYISQGIHPYVEYFKAFEPIASFDGNTPGGSRTYLNELKRIEKSTSNIDRATIEIAQATSSLEQVNKDLYPEKIEDYIKQLQDSSENAQNTLFTLNKFAKYLPELLGKDERKNYAILFQNPMELRSTGGWLTSFAIIGIEHGQVRTMDVEDVYNADGQLKIKVDPPEDMARALEIDEWNLALSNWNPDFPQSAEAAEYFLSAEDQVFSLDGVIEVDLEFVRNLIDVWREINVPGETEFVTKDNLYSKVIEIHRQFTPGSTRKEVFLSNLANEIVKNLLQSSKDMWPEIAEVILQGLEEKHILSYIYNTEVDHNLDALGLTGRVGNKTNTIFPVEWNWGSNKANFFLERATSVSVDILDENTINQEIEVTYKNKSSENKYPEGDYKCYVRVFFPSGVSITEVSGLEDSIKYTDKSVSKDVVSGWITVPVEDEGSFKIEYTLERDQVMDFPIVTTENNVNFSLNFIKQPGLISDPITVEISHPNSWMPIYMSGLQREINSLVIRTQLNKDKELSVQFEKPE